MSPRQTIDTCRPLRTLPYDDEPRVPMTMFIRDDDAGWEDVRLLNLLDRFERACLPIDLAVIPQALGESLAAELVRRFAVAEGRLGLHQHGYAHQNHELQARKNEFGPSRSLAAQRQDLLAGRQRLRARLGACLDPFFTPPWNRCASTTPGLLAALGFAGLSRDAHVEQQTALPELGVSLDWSRLVRDARAEGRDPAIAVANAADAAIGVARTTGQPIGLMLHHAVMDEQELGWLDDLLGQWRGHTGLCFRPMRELFATMAGPSMPRDLERETR